MKRASNPAYRDTRDDGAALPSDMNRLLRPASVAIVGASSGNLVEWFDFYTYSFTSLYFAASFFPKGDATSQLLNTAGIFALGFFMRPLGSWLFGRLADRHQDLSRKPVRSHASLDNQAQRYFRSSQVRTASASISRRT